MSQLSGRKAEPIDILKAFFEADKKPMAADKVAVASAEDAEHIQELEFARNVHDARAKRHEGARKLTFGRQAAGGDGEHDTDDPEYAMLARRTRGDGGADGDEEGRPSGSKRIGSSLKPISRNGVDAAFDIENGAFDLDPAFGPAATFSFSPPWNSWSIRHDSGSALFASTWFDAPSQNGSSSPALGSELLQQPPAPSRLINSWQFGNGQFEPTPTAGIAMGGLESGLEAVSITVVAGDPRAAIDEWTAQWRDAVAARTPVRQDVGTGALDPNAPPLPGSGGNLSSPGSAPPNALNSSAPNRIVLENQLAGTPESVWGIEGSGFSNIEGFASDFSIDNGNTVNFKINTDSTNYRIDIYRIGYYQGNGARLVDSFDVNLASPQSQPIPLFDTQLRMVDAGNWSVSASWDMPQDAVSGVYFAHLTRLDGIEGENHIPFVVRDDENTSDITFQTSDTTWQAYNWWGGYNLYFSVDGPRGFGVSYNRPIVTREPAFASGPQDYIWGVEYPAIRWLEQNGYDINYIAGVDVARNGAQLLNSDVFLSVGHDEYWSQEQRDNVEAARDAGVNLMFWNGNSVYWKTRWEESIDGTGTPYRTMVLYKEVRSTADLDPTDTSSTWRDPFYGPGEPENALMGTMFTVDSYRLDTMTVPYAFSKLRFWRNTDVADLQPGQVYSLPANLLGYEWDSDVDNGFRPAGLINMSETTLTVDQLLLDYGQSTGSGVATHALTLYRAESGALVFGAGTVYWAWALDANHDLETTAVDPNVQQAMVNLFADMGVLPGTLMASLVFASESVDTTAPMSSITLAPGSTFQAYQPATITGTAADTGGGRVAAVEISVDGGLRWHRAEGRENWSYTWTPTTAGSFTVLTRAVDDSVNLQAVGPSATYTVNRPVTRTLFTGTEIPTIGSSTDTQDVNLGVKFTASEGGQIVGIKYYRGLGDGGEHTGSLWSSNGTLLAQAKFSQETVSGWQTVIFSSPVSIAAGQSYVASYHTLGRYAFSGNFFNTTYSNGSLSVAGSSTGTGNGYYSYDPNTAFPGVSANGSNFWVDVLFVPTDQTNAAPLAGADQAFTEQSTPVQIATSQLLLNDSDADGDIVRLTGVGGAVGGTVSLYQQTNTVIFTPTPGLIGPASFTYTVTDGSAFSTGTVDVSVVAPFATQSLFLQSEVPAIPSSSDPDQVNLGVRFSVTETGSIVGIKFFKGTGDTGQHTGSLWSSTGQLLSKAIFVGETANGWQTVRFSNPIAIGAGENFVASYHSNGRYAVSGNYFNGTQSNGALLTTSPGTSVYAYGADGLFPTNNGGSANYWVDVEFVSSGAPDAVDDSGFSTQFNTATSIAASVLTANDTDPTGDQLTFLGVTSGFGGVATFNVQTGTITFAPDADHIGVASFTYQITDGGNDPVTGQPHAPVTGTVYVTVQPPQDNVSLFSAADAPSAQSAGDPNAVNLGVRFASSEGGWIKGIKYYKSASDTGTHTGTLWTETGVALANVTFTNETASGWQFAVFDNPVLVSGGTTYVASFHSNGNYAATNGYFGVDRTNGELTAFGGANGVYAYGASTVFPTASFQSSNYWVDVLFTPAGAPVAVTDAGFHTTGTTPIQLAASQLLSNDTDRNGDPLSIEGVGNAVGGTASYTAQTGGIVFTPTVGHVGGAGFTYDITDGINAPVTGKVEITVRPPATTSTLFAFTDTPAALTSTDRDSVNLGVVFSSSMSGLVSGVQFYKGLGDPGTHVGSLWTSTGTLLANATFTNETGSGWQYVAFANPVAITAGTSYVASYLSNGHYASTLGYFSTTHTSGPLTAAAGGSGVYGYGTSSAMPTNSGGGTNYWVDVMFQSYAPTAPVANDDSGFSVAVNRTLTISGSSLTVNDFDQNGDPLSIVGVSSAIGGTASFDAQTNTVSFVPTIGFQGIAQFDYEVTDGLTGTSSATVSVAVTAPDNSQGLFADTAVPAIATVNDPSAIELGMRFQSDVAGTISSIQFYKGPSNVGQHQVSLWTSTGTQLATATSTNETASGWQTVELTNPVQIDAGTTYVASYHTSGFYSASGAFFTGDVTSGHLTAPAGANGVYAYGSTSTFPTGSFNNTNYWVDVVFNPLAA